VGCVIGGDRWVQEGVKLVHDVCADVSSSHSPVQSSRPDTSPIPGLVGGGGWGWGGGGLLGASKTLKRL
jgi:hypothetical protein